MSSTAVAMVPSALVPDTYVLRSLLADVIVERARQLTGYARPEDALVGTADAMDWSAAAFGPEIVAVFGSAKTAEAVVRDLNEWVGGSPWPAAGFIGSAAARSQLAKQIVRAPSFAKTWTDEVRTFEAAVGGSPTPAGTARRIAHARQVALSAVELAAIGKRNASLARSQLLAQERELSRWATEADRRSHARAEHQRGRFHADNGDGRDWAAVDAGYTAMLSSAEWRQRRAEVARVNLLDVAEQVTWAAARAGREAERAHSEYARLLRSHDDQGSTVAKRWPWQLSDRSTNQQQVAAALRLHGALLALLPPAERRRLRRAVVARLMGRGDRVTTEPSSARTLFIAVPCLCTTPQHLTSLLRTPEPLSPGWLFVEEDRKPVRSEEMILRRHAQRIVTLSPDGDVVAVDDRVA